LQKTKVSAGSKGRKLRVAVIGATGYTGMELVRLLLHHPAVTLTTITSEHYAGKRLSEVHPSFQGRCDLLLEEVRLEALVSGFDLAFTALPHGISMEVVSALVASGKRVVDLSADFRLSDAQVYEKWYRPIRVWAAGGAPAKDFSGALGRLAGMLSDRRSFGGGSSFEERAVERADHHRCKIRRDRSRKKRGPGTLFQ
jgi:hypothetical protein